VHVSGDRAFPVTPDLPTGLTTTVRGHGGVTVVEVRGELDLYTAPGLRCVLLRTRAREVVLDLSAVTFLDTAALGVLVGCHEWAARRGGRLRLVCPQPFLRKVFRITGLDRVFALHDDIDAALAA